jgi:transmembrane 9 superfamily member 2/4
MMNLLESVETNRFGENSDTSLDNIVALWALFDIFNVSIGCFLGYKADKIEAPVKVARVKREIPENTPCFSNKILTIAIGSLLISWCQVSEIFYLVTMLWRHQYYFMYFYLMLSFFNMAYLAQTISIVQTYIIRRL